jgi:hypothetical protein
MTIIKDISFWAFSMVKAGRSWPPWKSYRREKKGGEVQAGPRARPTAALGTKAVGSGKDDVLESLDA